LGNKKTIKKQSHNGILEGFLSDLLKFDVKILEVLESDDKFNRVDLKVKDQQDNIIIEVQYSCR
jgi:hypothetical protein